MRAGYAVVAAMSCELGWTRRSPDISASFLEGWTGLLRRAPGGG